VTGHHSIFVEAEDGEPEARPVADLAPGDRVAIIGRIEVPERDRRTISIIETWRWNEGDPWELCVEAPGLGALAWAQRQDVFGLLVSQRRNQGPNWRNGAWTKIIRMRASDRVPLPVFWRIAAEMPAGARVRMRSQGRSVPMPARVELTDDVLWLLGLWVAEGSWHESPGNAFITLSADEELLDRAATIVERDLGLHVVRAPGSEARAASIFVHSRLLLGLMDFLGFGQNRKRIPGWILGLPLSRLKWFLEGYREGDGVHSGAGFEAGIKHVFRTVHDELKDDLVVALARYGLVPSIGRYETTFRKKTGDRRYPYWELRLAHVSPWSPLEWDRGVEQRLQARRTGDLVWAPVKEIVEVPATELVYDFSVPGLENFWAGTGVAARNTYGPRMRPHDGRAIPTFMRQALDSKPLTVFGDGSQTRSFCYVSDEIEGIYRLFHKGDSQPTNIGNPSEITVRQLAETVIRLTESESRITFHELPEDDPRVRQPDISRAVGMLDWHPQVDLEEGLRRTIEYFRRVIPM
jgi:intein/homing endonuclease